MSEPKPTARRKRLRFVVPGVTSFGRGIKFRIATVLGSKRDTGIMEWGPTLGNGTPVSGSLIAPANIPLRCAIVGTVPTAVLTVLVFFHSCETKKKLLFFPL